MQPIPHPSATRKLTPPADWNPEHHGPCATIEVADVLQSGLQFMETLWRPDAEELAALNAGAAIVLGINGTSHPVVYVAASRPPRPDPSPARPAPDPR